MLHNKCVLKIWYDDTLIKGDIISSFKYMVGIQNSAVRVPEYLDKIYLDYIHLDFIYLDKI